MQIGRKDVAWNFAGTFMRVASGLIVLPIVLRTFPKDEYGLWTIFIAVGAIVYLFDFGFSNALGRNITYVFSGVKKLKAKGYIAAPDNDKSVDYGLLKSVIAATRKYYAVLAALFLLLFLIASPFYLPYILNSNHYAGSHQTVWIAWLTFGIMVAYQLYTFYFGSLLMGRGMVKQYQQAIIIGQVIRILTIYIMVLLGFGLIALVVGQFLGDFTARTICYRFFYDKNLKTELAAASASNTNDILKIMLPNAARMGIATLGNFLVSRTAIPIASLFLSLETIGSFGITKQIIDLICSLSAIWFVTFYPKITSHRVSNQSDHLKRMYIKGKIALLFTFIVCGFGLTIFGADILIFIKSQTNLLPQVMMIAMLIVAFLEANHGMSAQMLLTKNEVPFAKAAIITGVVTILLLFGGLKYSHVGVWVMFLAPGIANIIYQNWKWPLEVIKDLNITLKDYFLVSVSYFDFLKSR